MSKMHASLYDSLPEGCIRLLTTQAQREAGIITGHTLTTYSKSLAPEYDALSYCWGHNQAQFTININGVELDIQENLLDILIGLLDREPPLRPIWIDAICLNQADNEEKAIHVPLMDQIYKNASRTIAYIEGTEKETEEAVVFIRTATHCLENVPATMAVLSSEEYAGKWEAVRNLLRRSWFRRLWIFQEVLLSHNIVFMWLMFDGHHSFTWDQMIRFIAAVEAHDGGIHLAGSDMGTFIGELTYRPDFLNRLQQMLKRDGHLKMLDLQDCHFYRQCTKPVDRVWALLGLLSPAVVSRVREAGIIDYSPAGQREYWKSYTAFMRVLYDIDVNDFFDVLTYDIGRGKTAAVPSWCIDFNAPRLYSSLRFFRNFRAGFRSLDCPEAATFGLHPVYDTLSMQGFRLDRVTRVTDVFDPEIHTMEKKEGAFRLYKWLMQCYTICCVTYGTLGVTKAQCCTMRAADGNEDADNVFLPSWIEAHRALERDAFTLSGGWGSETEIVAEKDFAHGSFSFEQYEEHYLDKLAAACHGRKMFATNNGRVGLGPRALHRGDEIFVVPGTETLFVLRKRDENYFPGSKNFVQNVAKVPEEVGESFLLIGDAYVYGMMSGEAFTADGRSQDCIIVLA